MAQLENLVGKRFGRLVVVSEGSRSNTGKRRWNCQCDCGNHIDNVLGDSLKRGRTKSCGCFRKEVAFENGRSTVKHGEAGSRLWTIWCGMKRRCVDDSVNVAKHYKNKGIAVCEEWASSYESFRDWATKNGYEESLTLDRIDVGKGYSPENCRWATYKVQENNRTNNRIVTIYGESHTLSEWADKIGINSRTLSDRIKRNWPEEDLFLPANLNNANIRKRSNKYVS